MKTTQKIAAVATVAVLLFVNFQAKGQTSSTQTTEQSSSTIQALAPDEVPPVGTFYLFDDYLKSGNHMAPPYPMNPYFANPNIAVYGLGNHVFMVDNTTNFTSDDQLLEALNALEQAQADLASPSLMTMDAMAMDADTPGENGPMAADYTTSTNLWIEVTTNAFPMIGQFAVVLHNTIQDEAYDLLTTKNLLTPLAEWTVAQTVSGAVGDFTPAQLAMNGETNLFVIARYAGSSTGNNIPDWWLLKYFGTTDIDPYALDSSGDGWTILQDYQNGFVPGTWNTPPAPLLSIRYDITNGIANINWSSPHGAVTGYTVEKSDWDTYEDSSFNFSSGTANFTDDVPYERGYVYLTGPTKVVHYRIQTHYAGGDSDWSDWTPLQSEVLGPWDWYANDARLAQTGPVAVRLIAPELPPDTVGIRVSRIPYWDTVASETNFDIPIPDVDDGTYLLPDWLVDAPSDESGNKNYIWYVQTIDADGIFSAGTMVGAAWANGSDFSTPFVNASVHLKENLKFLLRAATVTEPFSYFSNLAADGSTNLSPHWEYLDQPENGFGRPQTSTDYEYYGFHSFSSNLNSFILKPARPIQENFLWRNFVFAPQNYEGSYLTNGVATEVDYDNFPLMVETLKNPSFQYWGDGTESPLPLAMDTSNSTWLFRTRMDWIKLGLGDTGNWPNGWPPANEIGIYPDNDNNPILPSGVKNCFGLSLQSARVWTNSAMPFGVLPDLGDLYLNFEAPILATIDYYFANLQTALPGSPDFTPTNTQPLLLAGFGQTIAFSGWAKQEIVNGYFGKYAYLEQYFDAAYTVDTNGIATTNNAGLLNPYGQFFPTYPGPIALVTMPDIDSGARGTGIVNVVKLQLDVNHDGAMDLNFGGPDNTSQANPFVFWVNNDFDRGHDVDCTPLVGGNCDWEEDDLSSSDHNADCPAFPGKSTSDCDYQSASGIYAIPSARDLEDYTRLWIPGLAAIYQANSNLTFELSIAADDPESAPAINVFLAVETNGGTGYLTDTNVAQQQIGTGLFGTYCRIEPDAPLVLNNLFLLADCASDHFIWCGARRGKGQLVLRIKDGEKVLAETSQWIELKEIKEMYERWTVGDNGSKPPINTAYRALEGLPSGAKAFQYGSSDSTNTAYILHVHGWNMSVYDKDRYAETAFKRLYWQGYQGRFGSFRWPTYYAFPGGEFSLQAIDPNNYDKSEFQAWQSGTPLRKLLEQLNDEYPGHVYLTAHSMGNIVAGEALRTNAALVNTYIAMEAAVPSHTYDANATTRTIPSSADDGTPNRYSEYWTNGAPSYFSDASGAENYVNFFNTNDYALDKWTLDQNLKPTDTLNYSFDNVSSKFYRHATEMTFPIDTHEIFSFCDEARCFALGAQPDVGGVFQKSGVSQEVDLGEASYNFFRAHKYHSGQFRSNNMQRWQFWENLLIKMQLKEE